MSGSVPEATASTLKAPSPVSVARDSNRQPRDTSVMVRLTGSAVEIIKRRFVCDSFVCFRCGRVCGRSQALCCRTVCEQRGLLLLQLPSGIPAGERHRVQR